MRDDAEEKIISVDTGCADLSGERDADGKLRAESSEAAVRRLREPQREAARMLTWLTERERQVMPLMTSDLPNKTVAPAVTNQRENRGEASRPAHEKASFEKHV